MKQMFLVSYLFLAGCATAYVEEIKGPDGTPNQLVSCSYGIKNCYDKASEICNGKYKIISNSTRVHGDSTSTTSSNDLLVKCEG